MRPIPELLARIRQRGGKITPQRLLIYQVLEGNTTHPTAETIHEEVCRNLPTVSLTTVYKSLNDLVELGEVRRFDVGGVSHFDPNMSPHAEVVCLRCGRIDDVFHPSVVDVPRVSGFRIVGQSRTVFGYCASCDEAPSSEARA